MSDYGTDDSMPKLHGTLSDWRFFIFILLGLDSAAYAYLERLCQEHGPDYEIETEPSVFLEHVARVAFTNNHEGAI